MIIWPIYTLRFAVMSFGKEGKCIYLLTNRWLTRCLNILYYSLYNFEVTNLYLMTYLILADCFVLANFILITWDLFVDDFVMFQMLTAWLNLYRTTRTTSPILVIPIYKSVWKELSACARASFSMPFLVIESDRTYIRQSNILNSIVL